MRITTATRPDDRGARRGALRRVRDAAGLAGLALLAPLLLLSPAPAPAQQASPFLPFDHWAIEAVDRLDAVGLLTPGHSRGFRSLTVDEAARRFEAAARRAPAALAPLVARYRDRLEAELGGPRPAVGTAVHGAAFAGYGAESGRLEPGVSSWEVEDWTGPVARPDASGARLELAGGAALGRRLAGGAAVRALGSDLDVDAAYGVVSAGPVGAWLGRRPGGYRPGLGGGLVLDSVRMDGGGLLLTRPVDVPVVGAVRFETGLSRVADNAWIGRPWFWNMRLTAQPHARFGAGATRASMFGGERNDPTTLRNVAFMLIGKHGGAGSGFENQIAAIDLWYRPPMGLPVQLWIEWAFYDSAGAWKNKPAITAGVELPALPAAPGVALGLEYTHVSRHVQGHAIWYRHWWFHDGWVVEGEPLAHSLAGHGRQWLLEVTSELASADVRLTGRLLLRDRGEENLFAPDREGRSRGVAATAEWRPAPTLGVTAGWELERGDSGWEQSRGRLGARWLFGRVRP